MSLDIAGMKAVAEHMPPLTLMRTHGPTGGGNIYWWAEDGCGNRMVSFGTSGTLGKTVCDMSKYWPQAIAEVERLQARVRELEGEVDRLKHERTMARQAMAAWERWFQVNSDDVLERDRELLPVASENIRLKDLIRTVLNDGVDEYWIENAGKGWAEEARKAVQG